VSERRWELADGFGDRVDIRVDFGVDLELAAGHDEL
jgi:hypothetical protein